MNKSLLKRPVRTYTLVEIDLDFAKVDWMPDNNPTVRNFILTSVVFNYFNSTDEDDYSRELSIVVKDFTGYDVLCSDLIFKTDAIDIAEAVAELVWTVYGKRSAFHIHQWIDDHTAVIAFEHDARSIGPYAKTKTEESANRFSRVTHSKQKS